MRWPLILALFVAAQALIVGGCSGTDGPSIETASAAAAPGTAVPQNYREIIARNIRAKAGHSRIITAQISPPGLWVGPMGLGVSRPIACVRWKVQGTLGQEEYDTGYTFAEGHIDEVFGFNPLTTGGLVAAAAKHAYTCGKLTYGPFPEVMKPR
jgi:hypothetical protein